jgi:ribosomal protein L3 glutamine methyltransferase
MTLLELLDTSAERLDTAGVAFGHGTTNAFDEAAWLVLWCLGLPLDTPLEGDDGAGERPVTAEEQSAVEALVAERIRTRQPAAYLTGEAWLQGVPFTVDARVIVPRSLIAEALVQGVLDYWLAEGAARVLDLCTGNGSLAVLAAMAWPDVQLDAADLSTDALAVAAQNVQRHGLQDRIRLLQGDGLAAVPEPGTAQARYALILCNPPYVNADSMATLPPEYRAEPAMALAGGPDGMDFVRQLLARAPAFLEPDGALVLEIGHERAHFEAAFPTMQALWLDTSAGADQVCVLTHAALSTLNP